MAIVQAVAHLLTLNTLTQTMELRTEVLSDDAALQHLFQEARSQYYGRSNKRYGQMTENSSPFKALTETYCRGENAFLAYSQELMNALQTAFVESHIETEGHWLLVHERAEGEERIWWFHLKHRSGLYLDHSISLNEGRLLEMGRIGFAMCLQLPNEAALGLHQKGLQNLTLSFGFGDRALQHMLLEFVDFIDTVDTAADTENFISVVNAFTDALPESDAKSYRRDAVSYCLQQDQAGEPVSYQALSAELDSGLPLKLEQFIQQESPDLGKQFIPNRARLKKFVRYSGKNNEVSISFTNETLGKNVQFNPENETLVITDLPSALLKQLKQQLKAQ